MRANALLSRAEHASRSSKRVALKAAVDYVELVRDLAAMANSGGGVIVLEGAVGVEVRGGIATARSGGPAAGDEEGK